MTLKYTFNMSYEDIAKGMSSLAKREVTTDDMIHKLAVSILVRWNDTGDVAKAATDASTLLEAASKYKAQALVNWFSIYAGFAYDVKEKAFSYTQTTIEMRVEKGKIYFNGDDQPVQTFKEVTPPADPKPFKLPAKIEALIKQARSKREKGLSEEDDISEAMLRKLQAVLAEGE